MFSHQSWLAWFLKGFLILGFLLLFARLYELTIIKGRYYRALAEENRIKRISLPAARGLILARGGEVLVGNIKIDRGWARDYKLGKKAAHLTGYLGQVASDELGKINALCPEKGEKKIGDWVGRSGMEQEADCLLRGIDGEELWEVDTFGKEIRLLGKKNPVAGENLKTNIDFALQEKVAGVLAEQKGAVIVSDPQGEILALYSSPSFDPLQPDKVLKNPDLPLFNRVIGGLYHPGSVFKPLVAVAALEEEKISKDDYYDDTGVVMVKTLYGDFAYYNWFFTQLGRTEGRINLVKAIARSTDTFFYNLGDLVGIAKLNEWAEKFGLAGKTQIDLPGEVTSLVPTPQWKLETKGEPWFLGNTYHFAIGQGDLAITPIAENSMIAAIAANGLWCQPKIVGVDPKCRDLKIKKENLSLVKEGMKTACSPGGTGYTFFDWNSGPSASLGTIACKTGTAETNEDGKTHAWFVLFWPADLPDFVLTVLVEGGGEGSKVAGPLAREIMDFWNLRKNP